MEDDTVDPEFNVVTSRLLRREALRRAAQELNTTSGPGLESVLGRISAEVTAEPKLSDKAWPCLELSPVTRAAFPEFQV
jgi:hypothetical protein